MATPRRETIYTVHCPRCDRPFHTKVSLERAHEALDAHIAKAHEDYKGMVDD